MSDTTLPLPQLAAANRAPQTRRARGYWRTVGRRLRRDYVTLFFALVIVIIALAAILAPLVAPFDPNASSVATRLKPIGYKGHILGTDELGRDMLNVTVHGARISMTIGFLATIITIFFGAVIGIVAGFSGGVTDTALMRLTDFFLVLPTFVLAIILAPIILELIGTDAQIFGIQATLIVIVIVIGITSWATTARIIRSQVLSVKERMFVDRARVIGSGSGRIMRRHIFPNVVNLIVAQTVLTFATAVFTETTLSFIGLGDPFAPSWGEILNSAQATGAPGLGAWWYIVPPAACVVLVVVAFTLVGNALDDILNPKTGSRR
jgi:peptide/nickel transport system permease protein